MSLFEMKKTGRWLLQQRSYLTNDVETILMKRDMEDLKRCRATENTSCTIY